MHAFERRFATSPPSVASSNRAKVLESLPVSRLAFKLLKLPYRFVPLETSTQPVAQFARDKSKKSGKRNVKIKDDEEKSGRLSPPDSKGETSKSTNAASNDGFSTRLESKGRSLRIKTIPPESGSLTETATYQKLIENQNVKRKRNDEESEERESVGDFSYSDMATILDSALKKNAKSSSKEKGAALPLTAEHQKAVEFGADLPLEDGRVNLNPELNSDLQLVPHHLLRFQHTNTPPTLVPGRKDKEHGFPNESVNEWRQQELERTRKIIKLPIEKGLREILPGPEKEPRKKLKYMFPGVLDVSYPPDPNSTLLDYVNVKAVYKLNKSAALKTHINTERYPPRKARTHAYLTTLAKQEGVPDKLKTEDAQMSLAGLRRSESMESLDAASEREIDSENELAYDSDDNLQDANDRSRVFTNTIGTFAKLTNAKRLEDHLTSESSALPVSEASGQMNQNSLLRHERVSDALQKRHDQVMKWKGPEFKKNREKWKSYQKKRKLLDGLKPSSEDEFAAKAWQAKSNDLDEFAKARVGDDLKSPLDNVGPVKLKKLLSRPVPSDQGKEDSKKKKRKE